MLATVRKVVTGALVWLGGSVITILTTLSVSTLTFSLVARRADLCLDLFNQGFNNG